MSAHPFRRAGRNLAAAPLIWAGTALTNRGVRTMWPDDQPQTAADEAIGQVAAALDLAVQRFTDAVIVGSRDTKREGKQLNRLIRQFLDLRAVCVGDTAYFKAREQEQREREQRHGELMSALFSPESATELEVQAAQQRLRRAEQ